MCHLNLGNLMDVQERHITNRKCRDSGVQGWWGLFPKCQRFLLASTRVCHPLTALTGEAGSELASPSSGGTLGLVPYFSSRISTGGDLTLSLPILISSHSGSSAKNKKPLRAFSWSDGGKVPIENASGQMCGLQWRLRRHPALLAKNEKDPSR
ncbi:hypothetical protein J6590_073724 [Homalodisca vitripennis]|nr:hypothetical protein J6590_073724 [Homalodisca vitripennis]